MHFVISDYLQASYRRQLEASSYQLHWPAFLPRFVLGLYQTVYLSKFLRHFHLINLGSDDSKRTRMHALGRTPHAKTMRGKVAWMKQDCSRHCMASCEVELGNWWLPFYPYISYLYCSNLMKKLFVLFNKCSIQFVNAVFSCIQKPKGQKMLLKNK